MQDRPDKPNVAIFDLTDCEGCESTMLALGDQIETLARELDFVNFRLGSSAITSDHYDVAFIEGYCMNDEEAEFIEYVREHSGILVALGSCAVTGGIPAMVPDEYRGKWFNELYGDKQPRVCDYVKPIDQVVPVDVYLDGCPVPPDQLELALAAIMAGRIPDYQGSTVCQECKAKGNQCLLLKGMPCMGGITRSGCQAMCPSHGKACIGCFRPVEGANFDALIAIFRDKLGMSEAEIWKRFQLYNYHMPEFKQAFGDEIRVAE